jgi:hypothetical protein
MSCPKLSCLPPPSLLIVCNACCAGSWPWPSWVCHGCPELSRVDPEGAQNTSAVIGHSHDHEDVVRRHIGPTPR